MRNLALATISTAVVSIGLSSTPASAFTFMANPPPHYALSDQGYEARVPAITVGPGSRPGVG